MKETNSYRLVYKTGEHNDHIEENCHWYEYRLKGDFINKYRCEKHKIIDRNKTSWITEETKEEVWLADSPFLPGFLKQVIKDSKDPEIRRFSVMRTTENPAGYESRSFFKAHKKGIVSAGTITAIAAAGMALLKNNPQVFSR